MTLFLRRKIQMYRIIRDCLSIKTLEYKLIERHFVDFSLESNTSFLLVIDLMNFFGGIIPSSTLVDKEGRFFLQNLRHIFLVL